MSFAYIADLCITISKIDASNNAHGQPYTHYQVMRVTYSCLSLSLQAVVEGRVTNAAAIETWQQKDVDARTYIYSTIKTDQQSSLHGCLTASQMWSRIQTEYAQAVADNEHLLMAKFFEYKYQAGHSVMAHVAAIEQLAAHLKDLQAPVSEVQVMSKILLTLPPSFRHFLSAWDNVPTADKTIKLLTSRLVKEETITKNFNNGGSDPSDLAFFSSRVSLQAPDISTNALSAQHNSRGGYPGLRRPHRGNRGGHHGSRAGNVLCDYCKRKGHASAICRLKQKNEGSTTTTTCSYCQHKGHTVDICRKRLRNESSQPEQQPSGSMDFSYLSSICFSARRHYDWYADSGATQHMTDQRQILNNFNPIAPGLWTVSGIGNNRLSVLGQGEVEYSSVVNGVTHSGTIRGVLYVPGIGANLFSIASATDAGSEVHFIDNNVHLSRQGSIEMVGKRAGKTLYHLDLVVKGKHACTLLLFFFYVY